MNDRLDFEKGQLTNGIISYFKPLDVEYTTKFKEDLEADLDLIEADLDELEDDEKILTRTSCVISISANLMPRTNIVQRKIFEDQISTYRATIDSYGRFIEALQEEKLSDGLLIFDELGQKLLSDAAKAFPHPAIKRIYIEAVKLAVNMKLTISGILSPPSDFQIHLFK